MVVPERARAVGSSGRDGLGPRGYRERDGVGSALRWSWSSQSTSSLASRATTSRSVAASRGISPGGRTPNGVPARCTTGRGGSARGGDPGEDRRRGLWDGGSRRFGVRGVVMRGPSRPGHPQPAGQLGQVAVAAGVAEVRVVG